MYRKWKAFIQYTFAAVCLLVLMRGDVIKAHTNIKAGNNEAFANAISTIYHSTQNDESDHLAGGANLKADFSVPILMVKIRGGEPDWDSLQVNSVVEGPNHQYVLVFSGDDSLKKAYRSLLHNKNVEYVEKDQKMKCALRDEMSFSSGWSWGLDLMAVSSFGNQVKLGAGALSLKVAVVDTGIYPSPYFSDKVLKGKNLVDNTSDTKDAFGHGTHVAGTIFDMTRGLKVNLLPVKVYSAKGTTTAVIVGNGILYAADHGAKVVNLSSNIIGTNHSEYLHSCVNYAVQKGCVVVVSAGNDGGNVYNACPADMKNVIVVGAMNEAKERLYFSNCGESLDFMAPGVNIKSAKVGGGTTSMTGTSAAAPHIAGICALIKLMYPSCSPSAIEAKIKSVCRDMDKAGWDSYTGWGYPDLSKLFTLPANGISLDRTNVTLTAAETVRLETRITPENATNKTVVWTSSNPKVAIVSKGLVIGVSKGECTITASTANGKQASCHLIVRAAPGLDISKIKVKSYSVSHKKCVMQCNTAEDAKASGIQYELQNYKKNKLAVKTASKGKTVTFSKLQSQKLYLIRARYYYNVNGIRVYGTWSKRKAFCTAVVIVKSLKDHSGIEYTIPKVKGVDKFKVEFSVSGKAGTFHKICTGKQGRTYRLKTYKGKTLKKYGTKHKFYLRLKPKMLSDFQLDSKIVKKSFRLK